MIINRIIQLLKKLFVIEPQNTEELLQVIKTCTHKLIINPETSLIIENTLNLNNLKVRDIMMPKSQMVSILENASINEMINLITSSGHSRFPVVAEQDNKIIGILHAKDLLNVSQENFDILDLVRNVNFIPEGRKLDALLTDFRKNRNHLAIVVDEYGQTVGFVTLEDTLEQIIGEIADEFDVDEEDPIKSLSVNHYIMKGDTELELINSRLGTNFEHQSMDTIGGLVTSYCNYQPKRGEVICFHDFQFKVLSTNSRRIKLLECMDKRIK